MSLILEKKVIKLVPTIRTKLKRIKHPDVFQTNSRPYGQSYVKWTEKWWQWAFSIPKDHNPIIDKTGENCCRGQDGPVSVILEYYRGHNSCSEELYNTT